MLHAVGRCAPILAALLLAACPSGDDTTVVPPDLTAHCSYEAMASNADVGTVVTVAPLSAGAGEAPMDVPVGTALGGYTARAGFLGNSGVVDGREVPISGSFHPSIGVETRPMAKAVVLKSGVETIVWIKLDAIFVYEGLVFDLERRLGAEYHGKILMTASHSHSAWAQYTEHSPLKVGAGDFRQLVYDRILDAAEAASRQAIAAVRPAKLGVFTDTNFDPAGNITHDRRGENDQLPGGNRKDDRLNLIRIDGMDDQPIAVIPIYGVHGTLMGEDNPLASTDAIGGMERALEETFDHPVVVMHVQSAGADTSPSGHGGLDCNVHAGADGDPCLAWDAAEGHGRVALPTLQAAWTAAGNDMKSSLGLSMVTKSIELGPYPQTFTIRGGALAYAPFDLNRQPDRKVWDDQGKLISPIDEFNAPTGAALCQDPTAMFPAAAMPGVDGLPVYGSCVRLDVAGDILGQILDLSFPDIKAGGVACQSTRTTISDVWLGDYLVSTIPGELSVLLADKLRAVSPLDNEHTIAIGYAQGHVGYTLTPEDWLQGGYEPSVSFWGPLEGEYLVERQAELMPQAMQATRIDAAATGKNRLTVPTEHDTFPIDDPAPMAGTIPETVPADLWMRSGLPAQAQPAAQVPRVTGLATFVWLGDDPAVKTPVVTLEHEVGGTFTAVTRHSGRPVQDGDFLLVEAPSPLVRVNNSEQQHIWAVEWQTVPWRGEDGGLDELDRRGGLPLGRYRFKVEGKDWTITSDPFEVVAGTLSVTAQRSGTRIDVDTMWQPRKGWRLMTLDGPSNRDVPLAGQMLTVAALNGAGQMIGQAQTMTADATGKVTIDYGGQAGTVAMLRVTDRDGNSGTVAVPGA
ncbi:MAG TPA: neutral/alkaline non-lysosomal ceramidase N-terminal domain-containing protein [Kofleriaceae bacterium]|nr:neutral/alkaline non-lysosomal ceramidase N-terminal domain-containing protein [Kofleriaceae bacterium]